MRYYVTADVHGYFSELKDALNKMGYFDDPKPHQLIICGDLFDRGNEAEALQSFVLDLMKKDEIILIKGNHEDLAIDLLNKWHQKSYMEPHHHSNGTIDTICQLTLYHPHEIYHYNDNIGHDFLHTPYIQTIIPAMLDYYETDHYIFTHGWIPCNISETFEKKVYTPITNWRQADQKTWDKARWINGMEAAHEGIIVNGKTIVCGHWHCSFGHSHYENDGGEFNNHPNFNPYYAKGIIALDACTVLSKQVNCIIIED